MRRKFVAERYAPLTDAFYGGQNEVHIEVETTFEDGRTGMSAGDVTILDAETYGADNLKKAS